MSRYPEIPRPAHLAEGVPLADLTPEQLAADRDYWRAWAGCALSAYTRQVCGVASEQAVDELRRRGAAAAAASN